MVALRKGRDYAAAYSGRSMSLAGIICGIVALVGFVIYAIQINLF